jgi:hypothetical protein
VAHEQALESISLTEIKNFGIKKKNQKEKKQT